MNYVVRRKHASKYGQLSRGYIPLALFGLGKSELGRKIQKPQDCHRRDDERIAPSFPNLEHISGWYHVLDYAGYRIEHRKVDIDMLGGKLGSEVMRLMDL